MVSSAYLRLLVFFPAVLIPACGSSSMTFHMMHSVYKLNKLGNNIQPWCTPWPILNQSVVPCLILTPISCPISKVICYSSLFKNFPQFVLIHIVKGFSEVSEAEVDVVLEFPCFFYDTVNVGNLICGLSAFSKSNYLKKLSEQLFFYKIEIYKAIKWQLN